MLKPPKGQPWNWTPAGLRPEIARLVARPILVLPLLNVGSRPLEAARKRASVVNGSVVWVSSPLGPGMRFPNPSVGAPTDFLSFPSGYPATSADTVPHSIAVLWQPTVSANTHFPFMTASNGNGVFMRGSSSGFIITHGGVMSSAAIGSTLYAVNNLYLQLYSYDQVTLNHMIVNLTTGKSASQSVAETGPLATANGPRVAVKGASEALQGNVFGVAWVRGAWTLNEMEILARNATGIWTPAPSKRRIAYVPTGGGGSIATGDGNSQSDAIAVGDGASIAAGAAMSLAASVAFAVGVAISAGAGVSSSPSTAAGSGNAITAAVGVAVSPSVAAGIGAPVAAGAGASTSASAAVGSNDNVVAAVGIAAAPSSAAGVGQAIAVGDGRSVASPLARAVGVSIGAGQGATLVVSIALASPAPIGAGSGVGSSVAIARGDVSPPFDPSTLAPAPHYIVFDALDTSLDFDELATWIDFGELAIRTIFLSPQGVELMGDLKLIEGEVRDVEYVVRGAAGVPLDLTNSVTRKLTVRVPGQTPRVDQVDVTVVGAASDGRLKLAANVAIAGVAGRYKALTVVTYPGGVIVKSPGEVLVESAIA
jgi:hypothetical protein